LPLIQITVLFITLKTEDSPMKKHAILLTLALSFVFVLSACIGGVRGSGVRKTEKRELTPFTAIETTGAFEVEVICQKPVSFEIEADDNILPLIQTEVRDGVLHVKTTKSYSATGGVLLRISVPDLTSVKSTGAGKFHVSDVKNDNFEIDSMGAATVIASGQSKALKISSTGAGKIDAHDLRAQKAEVTVTGAAGVEVNASDELDVTVSGAGRVTYSGNPKVNKHVSGAGQVTKKEATGA
jgi:Putative auto-transporter adhesin, head GIN domain